MTWPGAARPALGRGALVEPRAAPVKRDIGFGAICPSGGAAWGRVESNYAFVANQAIGGGTLSTAPFAAGSLAEVCAAIARVLSDGGLFGFTVETHAGEGAIVGPKMRYAHSERFVRDAIAEASLTLVDLSRVSTRNENRAPVPGLLVVARK